MNSELIVMTFRHRDKAQTVLEAIRAMRKSPILSLENVVVATRNCKGEITVCPGQQSAAAQEDRNTQALLTLAGLILCAPTPDTINAITARGVDSQFVSEIARSMEGESSALFILTRENSVHDVDEMRSTLALFKGRIHLTSHPSEVETNL